jgi:HlyD family secretion protein
VGAENTMTSTNEKSQSQKSISKKSGGAKKFLMFTFVIGIAAVAIILVVMTRKTSQASTSGGTFDVRRENLTVTVAEGGSIRAYKSQQYKCQVQSRGSTTSLTILSIVAPGTVITQEDVDNQLVLVRLDSSSLEDRLVTEKMTLATRNDAVTSAKEAYDIQVLNNESNISAAELRVRFALLDLQKYMGEDLANRLVKDVNAAELNLTKYLEPFMLEVKNDPNILAGSSAGQTMKQMHDNITTAQGNLTTAQITLDGTVRLYDANFVSDLQLLQDKLSLQSRQFSLESATINQNLFLDYDFPKNTEQNLSNYIEAVRAYQRQLASSRSALTQASSRLTTAQSTYNDQVALVASTEQNIEYCTIKAEAPGLVVYGAGTTSDTMRAVMGRGGAGGSSRIIDVGETVTENQVILSIPDTSSWIAEIRVHETEVDKVRIGQPAVITMDVAPDKSLRGEVMEVAPLPDQQSSLMNPDLKVYKTLVKITGSEEFLKSSMSCKVEVLVGRAENAIVVPITVVANRGGQKICYVVNSQGSSVERSVKTGLFNDKYIQILEGLEIGEKVLLNPPFITGTSSTTTDVFEGVALPKIDTNQPINRVRDITSLGRSGVSRGGGGDSGSTEGTTGTTTTGRGTRGGGGGGGGGGGRGGGGGGGGF